MTNGADGWARGDRERGVRAKAVSSLRFATAVQNTPGGWMIRLRRRWRVCHVAAGHRPALLTLAAAGDLWRLGRLGKLRPRRFRACILCRRGNW